MKSQGFTSVCQHDNVQKSYRIGLRYCTLPGGLNRKDKFINETFLNNGFGFIHQKYFYKNQNSIFPTKYTK